MKDARLSLKVYYRPQIAINLLPDMPVLDFSNSAANKDILLKILTNGDTISCLSRKHCGKRKKIARYEQFLLFPQCLQKPSVVDASK